MGYSSEYKTTGIQQQASEAVKEKTASLRVNRNLKFEDKRVGDNSFGQPYVDRYNEFRMNADGRPVVQLKPSGSQCSGSGTKKDDELVKHMSNLPGYLQQMDRGENLQEKALNFGVLDWKRLEKWKYDEKLITTRGNTKASPSGSNSSLVGGVTTRSKSLASPRKKSSSHGCHLNSTQGKTQGVQSPGKVTKLQGYETAPWSSLGGQRDLRKGDKYSDKKYSELKLDEGKRKESYHTLKMKTSYGERHGLSLSSIDTMNAQDGETNTTADFERQSFGQQSIVLLLPKSSPKRSSSESIQFSNSRTSIDLNLAEENVKRFSECFSPEELQSIEIYSEIPHSCPLPVSASINIEDDMAQCSSPFDESQTRRRPNGIPITVPSKGECREDNGSNIEPSTKTETSKRLDQDMSEQLTTKGRHPSPGRRFSFSNLGRMTRSLSFKEGPSVPQLSSSYATVKSGPVLSEIPSRLDYLNNDNSSASNRARSSPLRRLLEPLLKPRGVQSAETFKPSKINLNPMSFKPMDSSELLQIKKHETSSVQALLQLTLKNGLPLFKLVVDNSSDILAAAVKKLPTPGEDVSSLTYALYSVHEIKKKSGSWMGHGSKGKGPTFGYKIVGQMKVSSLRTRDLKEQNRKDQYVAIESTLYGVDIGQANEETPEFMPSRELAAIVIENQSEKNYDGEQSNYSNSYSQKGFADSMLEDTSDGRGKKDSNSTIVILPGGVHGLPNKGVPSPLISRWRSGGSCDCGGWDVGCKLQILTSQDNKSKNLRPSVSCSTSACLDLFVEGGNQEKKPIFSLSPFKNGVYSVEYNPSVSLVQAFFISVAFLSSQKLSNIFEVKSGCKSFSEPTSDKVKTPTTMQAEVPAKYVTSPPPSPVGRV